MISEYHNYIYWFNKYVLNNGINEDHVTNAESLCFYGPAHFFKVK